MKISILGAGPVGLLACHAAHLYGHTDVRIHSIKMPSRIPGAQYLHSPISELTDDEPEDTISYVKRGTREGYATKIYGDPAAPCSWDRFEGEVDAWAMRQNYTKLWDKYEKLIEDGEVRYPLIEKLCDTDDLLFSGINPLGYCQQGDAHIFNWQQVRINDKLPEGEEGIDQQTIVYNGDPDDDWYRCSLLFGIQQAEYIDKKGYGQIVRKPLSTTCDCLLEHSNFHRLGRYGEFKRGLLSDDAFFKACEVLDAV